MATLGKKKRGLCPPPPTRGPLGAVWGDLCVEGAQCLVLWVKTAAMFCSVGKRRQVAYHPPTAVGAPDPPPLPTW